MTSLKVDQYFIDSIPYPEFIPLLGLNLIYKAESIMPPTEDPEIPRLTEYEIRYIAAASQFIWTTLSGKPFSMDALASLNGTSERYMTLERRFSSFQDTVKAVSAESSRLILELVAILEHDTNAFTVEVLIEKFKGRGFKHFRSFMHSLIALISPNDTVHKYYKKHVTGLEEYAEHIFKLEDDSSNLLELLAEYGIRAETIEILRPYSYNPDFFKALRSLAAVLKRYEEESDNIDSNLTSVMSRYGFGADDIKLLFELFDLIKPFFGVNISTTQCKSLCAGLLSFYIPLNPNTPNILVPMTNPEAATAFSKPNIQKLGLLILADPEIDRAERIRSESPEQLEQENRMTYAAKIKAKIQHSEYQRKYGDEYQLVESGITEEIIKEISIEINSRIEYMARAYIKGEYIEADSLNKIAKTIYTEVGLNYVPKRLDETSFNMIFRAVLEVIEDNERFITGIERSERVLDFGMLPSKEMFENKLSMKKLLEYLNPPLDILNTLQVNGLTTFWLLDLEMIINDGNYEAAASNIYQLFLQKPEQDYGFNDLKSILSWLQLFVGWVAGTMGRSDISKLLINLIYRIEVDQKMPPFETLY